MRSALPTTVLLVASITFGYVAPPAASANPAPVSACDATSPNATKGGFSVLDGKIYGPSGQPFIARGINVYSDDLNSIREVTRTFPGVNFVRVNNRAYDDPGTFRATVNKLTAQGIVVEFEDHPDGGGGDAAGTTVFGGRKLAAESAWYASMARFYKNNPYVWFGTYNEPPTKGGSLSQWQLATYNAIRNGGNSHPILLEVSGSRPSNLQTALDPSVYAKMTNVIWDPHAYNYQSNYSTDQATVDASVRDMIAAAQTIKSANGMVPVIIAEFGNSTTGLVEDPGGMHEVRAVINSGVGSAAFTWTAGSAPFNQTRNIDGSLTAYGLLVAAFIRGSATEGCAQGPLPRVHAHDVEDK